jgi:hypothetical protein
MSRVPPDLTKAKEEGKRNGVPQSHINPATKRITASVSRAAMLPSANAPGKAPARLEVFALLPGLGFLGVASGGPAPQLVPVFAHGVPQKVEALFASSCLSLGIFWSNHEWLIRSNAAQLSTGVAFGNRTGDLSREVRRALRSY